MTEENPPPDAVVVEDDSGAPEVPGMGKICEAVIFTKDGEVIDFKYVRNDC